MRPLSTFIAVAALILALPACTVAPFAEAGYFPINYAPPMAAPSPLAAEILALHNGERRRVGVPAMSWDAGLEAAAAAYARSLAASGAFAHSAASSRPGQGENLWRGTRGAYRPAEMIGGWLGEGRLFRPGRFPAVSTTRNWADVGHYSQIIWRGSTRLGCAIASSGRYDVLVCRYSPAGNIVGVMVP